MTNQKAYIIIENKLKALIPKIKDSFINEEKVLYVKFSADGAQNVKNKLILNLTFTILNEGSKAKTASGNYTFGIFDIDKEDYEELCLVLNDIKDQIEKLDNIEIDGEMFKIETFMGGDLKILAIIYGINAANANIPCIWCKFDKTKLVNVDIDEVNAEIEKEWSIENLEKGARTIEDAMFSIKKIWSNQ